MKNICIKTIVLMTLILTLFTSCVNEDDFDIPTLKPVVFSENFEDITPGSGANEIAINLDGWINTNTSGTRVWSGKTFGGNKFAEFSSYYSASGSSDDAWLISSAIDLSSSNNEVLSFNSVNRFFNGNVLTVYISENYDGTIPGIATASWTELNPILPNNSSQNDLTIPSEPMDISSYNSTNVRIAFRYQGSKTSNPTTTFQLDEIKIYEN
ncbi:choice-of-anchor J domain-containing protein [uncultured Flavobacterium sp.]|jgi:hypothetical protein|uniref:choice-of-anchor J domain-containing protein n=1 Tax=uncultured Flavobacterium sp. TaxID=165435 RepID=UPI0030CA246A